VACSYVAAEPEPQRNQFEQRAQAAVEQPRNQFDPRTQQQPEPARQQLDSRPEEKPQQPPSLVPQPQQQQPSQTAFSSRYPLSNSGAAVAAESSPSPYTHLNQDAGVSPYFQHPIAAQQQQQQQPLPPQTQSPTPSAPGQQHTVAASYAPFGSLAQQQAPIPPFGQQQTDYSHLYGQDSLRSLVRLSFPSIHPCVLLSGRGRGN
jgi:hypothetical protein